MEKQFGNFGKTTSKIIKEPDYPEKNVATCRHCKCEFRYLNNEVEHYFEEAPFGGYGSRSETKCPACKERILLSVKFEPEEPIEIPQWMKKLGEKIKRKRGKE